jgi:hypothetical protein
MKMTKVEAQAKLIYVLQNAHAGELAAAYAYTGHGKSLFIKNKIEKLEILKIRDEELHHRLRLREMLTELGSGPRMSREWLMAIIGRVIGILCHLGGWFVPMYGAGKLESTNIFEYEVAAKLSYMSGRDDWVPEFLSFAELEWDHELYFRNKTLSHFLAKFIPLWKFPLPKEKIIENYKNWRNKL